MKKISEREIELIEKEIKMMLHASRDCLRKHKNHDTKVIRFDCRDAYYGEAFGMLRTLKLLGYGEFGAVNIEGTLNNWFSKLEEEVLQEENFKGSNECDHCFAKYGADDVRRKY